MLSFMNVHIVNILGPLAQLVGSPTAGPVIASLIPTLSHKFVEIDHEMISTVADLRMVVSYKEVCMKYWFTA